MTQYDDYLRWLYRGGHPKPLAEFAPIAADYPVFRIHADTA